jgi:hypothetical protein
VRIANDLFEYSCKIFSLACSLGILATMENPKNSYFWLTRWVLQLLVTVDLYCGDFQVCMLGGTRDKWTSIVGNFPGVQSLNIPCDRQHEHAPWGFARDNDGQRVWATSLESKYPRKMCVALVASVLEFAATLGLKLKAQSMLDDAHPLQAAQQSQMSVGGQPKPARVAPVVSDFSSVAVFLVPGLDSIPCALMSKLPHDIELYTKECSPVSVPKYSRFVRFHVLPAPITEGVSGGQKRKFNQDFSLNVEVAFGLPWSYKAFLEQACRAGHPATRDGGVPDDLFAAVEQSVQWSDQQLIAYRVAWCRRWVQRAQELDGAEKEAAKQRHPEVAKLTAGKRLLLTEEMLREIGFEDLAVLRLLSEGATLAGEIEASPSFHRQYKPCLTTLAQLEANATRMNEVVLKSTSSSGDPLADQQLLAETLLEMTRVGRMAPTSQTAWRRAPPSPSASL